MTRPMSYDEGPARGAVSSPSASGVSNAFAALTGELNDLEKVIEELHKRIGPALRSMPLSDTLKSADDDEGSPLAAEVRRYAGRVESIRHRLREIMMAIDL